MPTTVLSQSPPSQSPSQPFNSLINSLSSPSGLLLLGSLGALIILSMMSGNSKGKIAKARWGGAAEKKAAMKAAIEQMEERKVDAAPLCIRANTPLFIPGANRGIAVCGGAGVGKTFSVIDPLLRSSVDQGYPIILYDFDYPNQTSRIVGYAARRRYKVNIFAPGYPETSACNPVEFLTKESDALMARQFVEVVKDNLKRNNNNSEDFFFGEAGKNLFVASMMLARSMPYADLMTCADLLSLDDIPQRVKAAEGTLNEWISRAFGQLVSVSKGEDQKTSGSIQGTTLGLLNRFLVEDLASAFCGKSTLPLDLEGRQMVVLGVDRQKKDVLLPIIAAILEMIVTRNVGKKRETPLVLCLDEVPTLYLESLPNWITQNRKDGLITILGFQNLAQLEGTYTKEKTRTMFGSCGVKFMFNPQELESAKMFSEFLGDQEVKKNQKSRGHSAGKSNTNTTEQTEASRLIKPEEFTKLPTGKDSKCIVIIPEFASKGEAFLPVREKLRFGSSATKAIKDSVDLWHTRLREEIEKRNRRSAINLSRRDRLAAIDEVLPSPQKQSTQAILENIFTEAEKEA